MECGSGPWNDKTTGLAQNNLASGDAACAACLGKHMGVAIQRYVAGLDHCGCRPQLRIPQDPFRNLPRARGAVGDGSALLSDGLSSSEAGRLVASPLQSGRMSAKTSTAARPRIGSGAAPVLTFEGVFKHYGPLEALAGVTFQVN